MIRQWRAAIEAVGAALFLLASGAAWAQTVAGALDQQLAQNICAAVESQTLEVEPKRHDIVYQYQTLIADAAGVTAADAQPIYWRKMRDWLNVNMSGLLCDRFNFQPRFGNVLKLAVASGADPFIDEVLSQWEVDLNQIDKADGGTVLDYIDRKRAEAGSNANLVRVYARYYNRFRAAGARHAQELRAK